MLKLELIDRGGELYHLIIQSSGRGVNPQLLVLKKNEGFCFQLFTLFGFHQTSFFFCTTFTMSSTR